MPHKEQPFPMAIVNAFDREDFGRSEKYVKAPQNPPASATGSSVIVSLAARDAG
jgi:hypothetical protein